MSRVCRQSLGSGPPLAELAARLPDERWPMLLDGAPGTGAFSAWRMLVFDPVEHFTHRASDDPRPRAERAFPRLAAALAAHWPEASPRARESDEPPFAGGAVGWFGYDLGRELELLPADLPRDAALPDALAGLYDFVIAEPVSGAERWVLSLDGEPGCRRGRALYEALLSAPPAASEPGPETEREAESTFRHAEYLAAVERVREAILDGEVYQMNLSQRFALRWTGAAAALGQRLHARHPSPYAAVLRSELGSVVSSSPELFLRRRGKRVLSRPIKGTRPRGEGAADDARLRAELEASEKENAELAMIVDLARNDLGRVARIGSVEVELPFETEAWPTVFHRVAGVRAALPPGLGSDDLLEASFPPASVTGTPKLAALRLIEQLEPVRRHVYTGALGWWEPNGDLELSVAIRIATLCEERLLVPVGGGITLGSVPQAEFEETLHKGRALFDVLGLASVREAGA